MGLKSKKDYPKGAAFQAKEMIAKLMTTAYYMFPKQHKINLEKVIEWFFTIYLNKEFKVEKNFIQFYHLKVHRIEKSERYYLK
ncbi:hypothetical protein KHA80_06275 [Anaerobacillus sp. HL2]|nr:hypothetical protein KHA80_06275 [Anaerobacillus sp. HL2]